MLRTFFKLDELGTTVRQEILGGATTFATMAYIIIVNPMILKAAGLPPDASMAATIYTAFIGTLAMGLYANRPFAIAPYMGENAFIAYTVIQVMGYTWETALGAIFLAGILFTLTTMLNIRNWLARSIPESLKIGFAVGIGLFMTFIGLYVTGIVEMGPPCGPPVHVGKLYQPQTLLAILGFLIIAFLLVRRITGAILFGILSVTFLAIVIQACDILYWHDGLSLIQIPDHYFSMPPSVWPIFNKMDLLGVMQWSGVGVVLTIFIMGFVDTMGTLLGVAYKAGLLDRNGDLPQMEKPLLCDALTTTIAPLLGTTTSGAFIESAAGVQAGARSGLASVVTALLFLPALFLSPVFTIIPAFAYGPALIIVGMLMLSPVNRISFDDMTDLVPSFTIIVLMCFTYNIGIGMTGGFIVYPLIKIFSGRGREVSPAMWILFGMSALFFIFYPY